MRHMVLSCYKFWFGLGTCFKGVAGGSGAAWMHTSSARSLIFCRANLNLNGRLSALFMACANIR
ncbi:MAG: hypothetical protein CTY16_00575 [Methylobacter sp.]|nr:MAG: hypothetical protein CTY16_00575 [Methylobacter sp.]